MGAGLAGGVAGGGLGGGFSAAVYGGDIVYGTLMGAATGGVFGILGGAAGFGTVRLNQNWPSIQNRIQAGWSRFAPGRRAFAFAGFPSPSGGVAATGWPGWLGSPAVMRPWIFYNQRSEPVKEMRVGKAGHHVPAVRKSEGRPFSVERSDMTRPTFHVVGDAKAKAQAHWRMHNAEKPHIGDRRGDFPGTDKQLFDAYRESYKDLNDIRVDVMSPNGKTVLGKNVTLVEAVNLIEKFLAK